MKNFKAMREYETWLRDEDDKAHNGEECACDMYDGTACEKCAYLEPRWRQFYDDLPKWVLVLMGLKIFICNPIWSIKKWRTLR